VVSVTGLAFFRLHYVVISVIRLSHSLVSEYANQHILSLSLSPEIGMVVAGRALA